MAGLRFVLACVIVSGHLGWFAPTPTPRLLTTFGGTAAVLGFLVISGYSIGHSLDRQPVGFYRRRWVRIYPLYAASLVYALVPYLSGYPAMVTAVPGLAFIRPTPLLVIGNLLVGQNLVCPPIDPNPVLWTMGIEVALYAAAPLLRRWPTWALLVPTAASAAAFAAYPHLRLPYYTSLLYGLPLLLFAWAWLGGFLLHRSGAAAWVGVAVASGGGVLLTVNHAFGQPCSVPTFAVTTVAVTFAGRVPVPPPVGRWLNRLGDLCYPLYLFHFPTFLLGYCILGLTTAAELVAAASAVSVAALLADLAVKQLFAQLGPRQAVPARPA